MERNVLFRNTRKTEPARALVQPRVPSELEARGVPFGLLTLVMMALTGPVAMGQLYNPGAVSPVNGTGTSFTYRDRLAQTRTVNVYVRTPANISAVLPVVIWSHGGEGTTDAQRALAGWGEASARAGYLTVNVAHGARPGVDTERLCTLLELTPEVCAVAVDPLRWDRANDLLQTIGWLETMNATGPEGLRGRMDLNRMAVAGHGTGSDAALSLAGAARTLLSPDRKEASVLASPRPVAFLALSPHGPDREGFFDTDFLSEAQSWMGIQRPVLTVTAAGDNTDRDAGFRKGDVPSRRRIVFDSLPARGKYELYLNTVNVSHGLIGELDVAGCVAAGVPGGECTNYDLWIRSTLAAFLDGHVRGIAAALAWLESNQIGTVSNGVAEWRRK